MRITIRVRPGSARPGVGNEHDGALVVRVSARAVDGKATEAALADGWVEGCVTWLPEPGGFMAGSWLKLCPRFPNPANMAVLWTGLRSLA